ncbi:PREDICTED: uncharacterized protein LOC105562147 [Vollenhovia emeryi]|uniref:uncharacterized protein LOC105562147 n=1 Tax=Vollenhovia emeryi TaxID=411798 RepID=UPI0005F43572|nr:PREDICTED: uncharacterized protein LOC105562147 [Vollenhovia emeryi]
MSNQRRRAHDFTASLTSFRQTLSDEESSSTMSRVSSDNTSCDIRSKQHKGDLHSQSRHAKSRESVILAGSLVSQQYHSLSDSCNISKNCNTAHNNRQLQRSDMWNTSDDSTSYMSLKCDLNKCINLFDNEQLKEGTLEEQLSATLSETVIGERVHRRLSRDPTVGRHNCNSLHRSVSADSLRRQALLNREFTRSKSYTTLDQMLKRDTNYNLKADKLFSPSRKVKLIFSFDVPTSPKSPTLPSERGDERCDTMSSTTSKGELNLKSELTRLLRSLPDEKPLKEATTQRHFLRRLSANCQDSPRVFTERLLTIVEESVLINDSGEVSMCRFNDKLQKMHKFIEDETVPEWPQSPGTSAPISGTKRKSQEHRADSSRRSCTHGTPDVRLVTPVSSRRDVKSPNKIRRRRSRNSYMRNFNDNTTTFENLEAYCQKLFPNENKTSSASDRIQSESPLRHMDNLRRACESQMASLDNSINIYEEIKKAGTCASNFASQHVQTPETRDRQRGPASCENIKCSRKVSSTFKRRTECGRCYETAEQLDDLESTLMYEIARKRQRCLDTAKVMIEIDANLESTAASEQKYPEIRVTEAAPTMTTSDEKFMKVLMCVKNYQDYLEEYKPLLNQLHRLKSTSRDARATKTPSEKFSTSSVLSGHKKTLRTPRTPKLSPRKTSPSSAKLSAHKTVVSKPRLFVTPGKQSVNKGCKPKRIYFPNLMPEQNKPESNINLHAKKIYRQMGNYDHVTSPVALYIKGKEQKKNQLPKTPDKLTPGTKRTMPSPRKKFRSPIRPREIEEAED